jgi:hypothetical protein
MGTEEYGQQVAAPPVIGEDPPAPGETVDDKPGLVFLPQRSADSGDAELAVEVRALDDGRTALLAYNSLAALVEGCGKAQPWAAVKPEAVDRLVADSPIDVVLWDVSLPVRLRRED